MPFQLPGHVSFCRVADQIVVLDLKQDRYVQLPVRLGAVIDTLCHDPATAPSDADGLRALLDQGLIEARRAAGSIAPTQAPAPIRSLLEDGAGEGAVQAGVLISTAADLFKIQRALSARRLYQAVNALERLKQRRSQRCRRFCDVAAASRAFLAARRLVPIPAVCLLDSLALARHLVSRGAAVDVVLGVKLNPFRAHAWVQGEGVVLNDSLDRALAHHPIRVI